MCLCIDASYAWLGFRKDSDKLWNDWKCIVKKGFGFKEKFFLKYQSSLMLHNLEIVICQTCIC
jgi:hypothetical protein